MPELRTAHWSNDEPFELDWPADWSISIRWPNLPPPLSAEDIRQALHNPIGRGSLAELLQDKKRPLFVIDDLTRATPTSMILDPLLDELLAAGIPADHATILVATGTHPAPAPEALAKKIGARAAAACRVVVHDDLRNCVRIGKTSYGTPISVDREVLDADCLIGIGGIYPNNTAGFGGGPKLALGVLGRKSISHLHLKHRGGRWGADNRDLSFRKDLEEIAVTIGLTAMVSVHIDAEARPVRMVFGDHRVYYEAEARWASETYQIAGPGDADVVVANAYPVDSTLVSAYQKSMVPLRAARPGASRILLASCVLGPGGHGLFPIGYRPTLLERARRKASVLSPMEFVASVAAGLRLRLSRRISKPEPVFRWPVVLFRPGSSPKPDLAELGDLNLAPTWQAVLETIRTQHPGQERLNVAIYPCASLQVLDSPSTGEVFGE
jgi:nickel-dependent lactate racemase